MRPILREFQGLNRGGKGADMTHKEAEDRVRYILTQVPATQDEKIKMIADLVTGTHK